MSNANIGDVIIFHYSGHGSYVLDKNNEENKIDITGSYPRPKNMGIPEYIFNRDPDLSNIVVLRNYLGSSECNFMGSKQELIKQLLWKKHLILQYI